MHRNRSPPGADNKRPVSTNGMIRRKGVFLRRADGDPPDGDVGRPEDRIPVDTRIRAANLQARWGDEAIETATHLVT